MSTDPYSNQPQGRRQPGQSSSLQLHASVGESSTGPASAGGGSEYASGDSSGTKSPLNLGLGFLRGLGSSDKKNRDGQPAKRRGPKPDSKPALTRRQELNRQAQRTHRERKEIYIKSLEQEIMQLKEVYTGSVHEKNAVAEENRKLRDLLQMHGIAYENRGGGSSGYPTTNPTSSTASHPGANFNFTGSSNFSPQSQPLSSHETSPGPYGLDDPILGGTQQASQQGLDYDQLGVDFVLALEAACMDHLQFMCVRSNQDTSPEPATNGHAMMWSCPPFSHVDNLPDVQYPHRMPDMPNAELMKLLTLSQDLPLDGELTPVIALNIIRNHPRFGELTLQDFDTIKNELKRKTRCYGFGAVLEEFELRDALSSVFATKLESYNRVFQ